MESLPIALQEALITGLPTSGYYIPNFVTSEEETYLLHKVIRQSHVTLHALIYTI